MRPYCFNLIVGSFETALQRRHGETVLNFLTLAL
jgi:hypothetical protein